MPVTLAQAQINTQSDVDYNVIDNLRRSSWLLDQIVFDDTVTPGTGGASLTYAYTRLTVAAAAAFRALNTEYTPAQAQRQRYSVDLKPLGGALTLDRVLANLGQSSTNELTFQLQQLITAIRVRFGQELILGDTAVDATGFDGLSKALTGTTTEKSAGYVSGSVDWTSATVAGSIATANTRIDELDDWLSTVVPSHVGGGDQGETGSLPPGVRAILGNTKSITRVRSMARTAGSYTVERDDLGRQIQMYGPWTLVDVGDRYDGSAPIIPITSGGLTDLYAATFGLDSLHGASMAGIPLMTVRLPDYNQPGAVKSGEAEMGPIATVIKNTKSCAVLRGIKVQ